MKILTKLENELYWFQNISWADFLSISPEIYLSLIIIIALTIVGTANFAPQANTIGQKKEVTWSLYNLTKWSLFFTLGFYILLLCFFRETLLNFNAYTITDFYTNSLKFAVVFTMWIILVSAGDYVKKHPRHLMEYSILILLTTVFLLILISSYNLITLFLAIIGFSLNIYVLLLYDSFNHSSREAGIKYYYLSTFSSGLLIGGIFLAYLIFHNTSFISITWILHNWTFFQTLETKSMLLSIMIYFLAFGFLFKLAAFPCHLWAPEIYDGSPHPITAIFVLPIKIATFGLFLRLFGHVFGDLYYIWSYVIGMSAFFSMLWGCLGALGEQLIKRFVAYSSINQMGFLLMGLATGTVEGIRAALIYLFLYVLMNLGFFILFLNTKDIETKRSLTYMTDFNIFSQKNYLYSITLVVILFSMAGIPPLGGFFGKYYLFLHSFEVGHISLVVTGMATSVIATYYYLRIIKIMWFEQPLKRKINFKTVFSENLFVCFISLEFLLIWFIFWSPWILSYGNLLSATCINPLTSW